MTELSPQDTNTIEDNEDFMVDQVMLIDMARSFKIGDYLISFTLHDGKKKIDKSTYGTPRKFKVVFVAPSGVGYVKSIDNRGMPTGRIRALCNHDSMNHYQPVFYELDPDYVDTIIMQAEGEYDPSQELRLLAQKRREVISYNKTIKIPTKNVGDTIALTNSMSIGSTYWLSSKTQVTVIAVFPITDRSSISHYKKMGYHNPRFVVLQTPNGRKLTRKPEDFQYKNIYTKQPLSISKKNPI